MTGDMDGFWMDIRHAALIFVPGPKPGTTKNVKKPGENKTTPLHFWNPLNNSGVGMHVISCSSRKALDGKGESGKPFGLKSRVGPAFFSPPVT